MDGPDDSPRRVTASPEGPTEDLPVSACLPALTQALAHHPVVLVSAPTGSGKTTAIPGALIADPWLRGRRIILLEPRRLAARWAAERMALTRGESVGQTVGLRTGLVTRVSRMTRIEVMTEGVLTRRIQRDPELADVGLVIFDEVHERHLATDLGLALARDVQRGLRPDLRVLLMSATLGREGVTRHFPAAPLIEATGRVHPVAIAYLAKSRDKPLAAHVRAAVTEVLGRGRGDILVFLPGLGEIVRCEQALARDAATLGFGLARLHGHMSAGEQDALMTPAGHRRVILATAIAQSSLTLPHVDTVIDSGLVRLARFDRASGFTRLVTLPASRDVADQRAGRAGRTGPGFCLRLWTEHDHQGRVREAPPEIEHADLAPLALELAAWGVPDGAGLSWLTPPPAASLAQGQDLLERLGLMTRAQALTAMGRAAVAHGLGPRAGALILGARPEQRALACALAALWEERDPLSTADDCGIERRLAWLADHPRSVWAERAARLAKRLQAAPWQGRGEDPETLAELLLNAFFDRVAMRVASRPPAFKLASGQRARMSDRDALATGPLVFALSVEEGASDAWIRLAAPLPETVWERALARFGEERLAVSWNEREQTLNARRERVFGALLVHSLPCPVPDDVDGVRAVIEVVRRSGLRALAWSEAARVLRQRLAGLRVWQPECDWPDVSDEALIARVEDWLRPACARGSLAAPDIAAGLREALLSASLRTALERDAPLALRLPSGRARALRYEDQGPPVLSAPVQDFYGLARLPTIAGGRVTPRAELLSPAGRPLQVTSDIGRFWETVYPEIRRSLAARYPRHSWPLDPLTPPPRRRS